MFRDLGFVWYLAKDIIKGVATILFVISMVGMHFAPAPWDIICAGWALGGLLYIMIPMMSDLLQSKYRKYRAEKEQAWDVLKDTK